MVSTCYSCGVARSRRVVPHYFADAMHVLAEAAERGFTRAGWVSVSSALALRDNHLIEAVFTSSRSWHGLAIVPALSMSSTINPWALAEWIERNAPDLIVTDSPAIIGAAVDQMRLRSGRPPAVAQLGGLSAIPAGWMGVAPIPREIGWTAVSTLAGILRDEEAMEAPWLQTTMIEGPWVGNRSDRLAE